ncbi:hypothetical protein GC169_04965 [bacterium]|nr:hypothetical protein [bacterium]
MSIKQMTETRFLERLAVYGADLRRWPAEERDAAEDFLEGAHHRARDIWESERAFDRLLGVDADEGVSDALASRVRDSFRAHAAVEPRRRWVFYLPRWAAGGTVAASLALGFAAGYASESEVVDNDYAQMLTLTESASGGALLLSLPELSR